MTSCTDGESAIRSVTASTGADRRVFASTKMITSVAWHAGVTEFTSNPPQQHKNDNDNQDGADDSDAAMSVAITIAAEAAAESTKQKDDQDDDKDESY
jgi:hypothetical protein